MGRPGEGRDLPEAPEHVGGGCDLGVLVGGEAGRGGAGRPRELAEGHAGYRYSGYVTVTESDEGALEHACGRVEQAAALAQLELRRLYGAQEDGYCCTLPTGRGCR